MNGKLKTVLFGFDKKETLNYIERYQRESHRKISALEVEIELLKEQADKLKGENETFKNELLTVKKKLIDAENEVNIVKEKSNEQKKIYVNEIDDTYKKLEIMRDNMKSALDSFINQVENINDNLENAKNSIDSDFQNDSVNDKIMYI